MPEEVVSETKIVSARLVTLEVMLSTFKNIGLEHDFRLSLAELSHVLLTKQLPPTKPQRRKRFPLMEIVASAVADYEEEIKGHVNGEVLSKYGWTRDEIDERVGHYHEKPKLKIVPKPEEEPKMKDPFKHYLNEIGKYNLLKRNQEIEISARVRQGDMQARNEMMKGNFRLVVSIATHYQNRGLSMDELVSYGNEGVLIAIEKYNLIEGTKFSTYASWWIKQKILRGIMDDAKTVRVPSHMVEKVGRVRRTQAEHLLKSGMELDAEELSDLTGYSVSEVKTAMKVSKNSGNSEYRDISPSEGYGTEELAGLGENWEMAMKEIDKLPERSQRILLESYGVGCDKKTLQRLGNEWKVSRERARQIQAEALKAVIIGCGVMTLGEYNLKMKDKPRYQKA